MKGYTVYDEAKSFDMNTDSAEELLEKLPPEEKKRLAKQLLFQEKQRKEERRRGTKPSAREVFEMRAQAEVNKTSDEPELDDREQMVMDWVND